LRARDRSSAQRRRLFYVHCTKKSIGFLQCSNSKNATSADARSGDMVNLVKPFLSNHYTKWLRNRIGTVALRAIPNRGFAARSGRTRENFLTLLTAL
jgi:hypothetical protein